MTTVGLRIWIPEWQFQDSPQLSAKGVCPCPNCGWEGDISANGFTTQHPHRVMGKHYSYFIIGNILHAFAFFILLRIIFISINIGRKYTCRTCQSKKRKYCFVSHDADVLAHLPKFIQMQFGLVQSSPSNSAPFIEETVQDELVQYIFGGGTFAGYKKLLDSSHSTFWCR